MAGTFLLKEKYLNEKQLSLKNTNEELEKLTSDISGLEIKDAEIKNKIGDYNDPEQELELLQKERNALLGELKKYELQKNSLATESNSLNNQIKELDNEIFSKKSDKKQLLFWTKIQRWLEEYFTPMASIIEKQILSRVHYDFDSLFQKWFDMLIGDDAIKVSLNEEFGPIIEQNGHLIDYSFLSGGEKTAIALAYRLALNQVINILISVIKTKDFLILDEPTDGFSESQVDRIKTVLSELNMNQIILVSHESKVERFVDNVINIRKEGHVSQIYHN